MANLLIDDEKYNCHMGQNIHDDMSIFSCAQITVGNQDRVRRLPSGHEINQNKEMKWFLNVFRLTEPINTIFTRNDFACRV